MRIRALGILAAGALLLGFNHSGPCLTCHSSLFYCYDPYFELHATTTLFGSVSGPHHSYCAPGSCAEHASCGGETEAETSMLEALTEDVSKGSLPSLWALLEATGTIARFEEERRALQLYSACDQRWMVAHVPLATDAQMLYMSNLAGH